MFSANDALSHNPPNSWSCWTSGGSAAAGKSNIAISWGYDGGAGAHAVDLYMNDPGAENKSVGHRRWILYPRQIQMDSGSIPNNPQPAANALWVLGIFGPPPATPNGVAWPPRGYVPWQILPSSNRWSFSWPGANFAAASVTMTRNGASMAAPAYEPIAVNYGDNTLVWLPVGVSYAQPATDTTYRVTISGISGGGAPSSITYDVIVINPYSTPAPPVSVMFSNGFE